MSVAFKAIVCLFLISCIQTTIGQGRFENPDNGNDFVSRFSDNKQQFDIRHNIPGEPDIDYPIYSIVPRTSFSCDNRHEGYYADVETRCQAFRICANTDLSGDGFAFLCPNGTLFSQRNFVCDWYRNVDCRESENYYFMNEKLGKMISSQDQMFEAVKEMIEFPIRTATKIFTTQTTPASQSFHRQPFPPVTTTKRPIITKPPFVNDRVTTFKPFGSFNRDSNDINRFVGLIPPTTLRPSRLPLQPTILPNRVESFPTHKEPVKDRRPITQIPITREEAESTDLSKLVPPGDIYVSNLGELSTDPNSTFDPQTSFILDDSLRQQKVPGSLDIDVRSNFGDNDLSQSIQPQTHISAGDNLRTNAQNLHNSLPSNINDLLSSQNSFIDSSQIRSFEEQSRLSSPTTQFLGGTDDNSLTLAQKINVGLNGFAKISVAGGNNNFPSGEDSITTQGFTSVESSGRGRLTNLDDRITNQGFTNVGSSSRGRLTNLDDSVTNQGFTSVGSSGRGRLTNLDDSITNQGFTNVGFSGRGRLTNLDDSITNQGFTSVGSSGRGRLTNLDDSITNQGFTSVGSSGRGRLTNLDDSITNQGFINVGSSDKGRLANLADSITNKDFTNTDSSGRGRLTNLADSINAGFHNNGGTQQSLRFGGSFSHERGEGLLSQGFVTTQGQRNRPLSQIDDFRRGRQFQFQGSGFTKPGQHSSAKVISSTHFGTQRNGHAQTYLPPNSAYRNEDFTDLDAFTKTTTDYNNFRNNPINVEDLESNSENDKPPLNDFVENDVHVKKRTESLLLQGVHVALYENDENKINYNRLSNLDAREQFELFPEYLGSASNTIVTTIKPETLSQTGLSTDSSIAKTNAITKTTRAVTITTTTKPTTTTKQSTIVTKVPIIKQITRPTTTTIASTTPTKQTTNKSVTKIIKNNPTLVTTTTKTSRRSTTYNTQLSVTKDIKKTTSYPHLVAGTLNNRRQTVKPTNSTKKPVTTGRNGTRTINTPQSSNKFQRTRPTNRFSSKFSITSSTQSPSSSTATTRRTTTLATDTLTDDNDLLPQGSSYGFRSSLNRIRNVTNKFDNLLPKRTKTQYEFLRTKDRIKTQFFNISNTPSITHSISTISTPSPLLNPTASNQDANFDSNLQGSISRSQIENGYAGSTISRNQGVAQGAINFGLKTITPLQNTFEGKSSSYIQLPGTKVTIAKSQEQGHFTVSNDPAFHGQSSTGPQFSDANIYQPLDQFLKKTVLGISNNQHRQQTITSPPQQSPNYFLSLPTIPVTTKKPTVSFSFQAVPSISHQQPQQQQQQPQYPSYAASPSSPLSPSSPPSSSGIYYQGQNVGYTYENGFGAGRPTLQRRLDSDKDETEDNSLYSGPSSYNVPIGSIGRLPGDIAAVRKKRSFNF